MEYKKQFNRRRSQRFTELEELIRGTCRNGTMEGVLENRRLSRFVSQVALERLMFDYVKLEFVDRQASGVTDGKSPPYGQ